jgi:Scavenger receptor cysteine-rich domain
MPTIVNDLFACSSDGGVPLYGQALGIKYGPGTGMIWMRNVVCSGGEASLSDCSHAPWGSSGCLHSDDVSITCKSIFGKMRRMILYEA